MNPPKFIIKNNMNKSSSTKKFMRDIIKYGTLKDVCIKLTGEQKFDVEYVDNEYEDSCLSKSYNKGRLAVLIYGERHIFISFSNESADGRNSAIQSVPTAFNTYYQSKAKNKELYYYFLSSGPKFETDYLLSIYRQMKTIGFNFINPELISSNINSYSSIEDLIFSKTVTSGRNKSNKSSYVTKEKSNEIVIYGKTYGANKYDAVMLGFTSAVLAKMNNQNVVFYEILEGNLKHMPKSSSQTLELIGNVEIVSTNLEFEKKGFETSNSLRSPRYQSNLMGKLGTKTCALCNCEIPEIIQGAHVWPVSVIKKQPLTIDEQLTHAISGENGIWLCQNHHKLFDENIISFDNTGKVKILAKDNKYLDFIQKITHGKELPKHYYSKKFFEYLELRNNYLNNV